MAQYEESVGNLTQTLEGSGLNEDTLSTITALISGQGDTVQLDTYDPDEAAPEGTEIVTVGSDQQLTSDPGASVIIMDSDSQGANVELDTSDGDRVVVAGGGDDNIVVTGDGAITIETGGGNDTITTGLGDDTITVTGSGFSAVKTGEGGDLILVTGDGEVTVSAGEGNDTIIIQTDQGATTVDGGAGFDTAGLDDARGNHNFTYVDGVLTLNSSPTQLEGVEVIQFADSISVVAENKDDATVARLYEVLFDREADVGGLEHWFNTLDVGMSIGEVAENFITSTEFQNANASVSNEEFLTNLYQGMAGREPDEGGLAHWLTLMEEHNFSKADVALEFAQSAEAVQLMGIDGNQYVIDLSDIIG